MTQICRKVLGRAVPTPIVYGGDSHNAWAGREVSLWCVELNLYSKGFMMIDM